ncbi:MAG: dockerin type I repeat-containing protein [Oscillospiraceae bacterium]|nr:dockerin type I repeat-containing protein [Oscillospiraceae bacterium]
MMKLKKTIAVSAVLTMAFTLTGFPVSAEDSADIIVTIADKDGNLVMTQDTVRVTDLDGDGVLTIYDALYQAHEDYYDGGAEAGFGTEQTQYGLSLAKLWGTANGGSYGYYVNHSSAFSMTDPVQTGDYLYAFVYTDLTAWSDSYSFFDQDKAEVKQGDSLDLTLFRAAYDENWTPVTLPVENAVITINGKETEYRTDAEGKVTVTLENAESSIISAKSETLTLVPPVCIVSAEESSADNLAGDADQNGTVNILDVITINKAILGKESLTEQGLANVDFNQNQKPDSDESLAILKYIVGLITDFSQA